MAVARAIAQLALVSLILTAVLGAVVWSLAFALVMLGVAVGDVGPSDRGRTRLALGPARVAIGAVPVLVVIFASGAVPWNGAASSRWPASSSAAA